MDDISVGQASAAVAMANSAIDNARRAAATSRSRRAVAGEGDATMHSLMSSDDPHRPSETPRTPRLNPIPGTAEFVKNDSTYARTSVGVDTKGSSSTTDLDLKHNDNAYHVVATLVTDRLLPKLSSNSSYYTVSGADVEFFSQMLPYSVRRAFVEALRYRLQSSSAESPLGRLSLQCQILGLDREKNVLLDLGQGHGMTYSVYRNMGLQQQAYGLHELQEPSSNQYGTTSTPNGVNFGLSSPLSSCSNQPANLFVDSNPLSTNNNDNYYQDTAESLARQQIMAEINETKFLMRGSVTPEAVSFWKKHLEELSERLVALSKEEQIRRSSNMSFGTGNVNMDENRNGNMYQKVKQHYSVPNIASREEYLEKNRKMREEAGLGDHARQLPSSYTPPEQILNAQADVVGTYRPAASSENKQQEELPVCDVVAPSDLPGGYMFEAQLGSKKFLATVPPGGVTKGQRFVSTMKELEIIEIPVPLGAWRDESCECLNHGVFHPLFLNTVFVPCIALGQIMTRAGLDWYGEPASKLVSGLSCANMTVMLTFWLAMNASALFMFRVRWERGMDLGIEFVAILVAFNLLTWCYLINLTRNVRESIRNKYQIPEERCVGCEDCMCATFCTPCTICHMGRHTADFETYRGTCCSSTGLPRQVELAQVTFYEDQYQNVDSHSSHVV
ncbi:hypothetical protein HJC23_012869 [Cyclotella cryptica]|uniref:Uncharacterized protein n=1 Tax=Cyclotella cryptica TaxID=29204 RepID=A0ABD3Q2B3_9STRA|eukprot:CCRYP_009452-RA/>CCRYP_009452-RA protein AED:0.12 eAED:0.12 QI:152/1/1/1/1/1/3/884/672